MHTSEEKVPPARTCFLVASMMVLALSRLRICWWAFSQCCLIAAMARVESLKFKEAFNYIFSGLTFVRGVTFLVNVLLDVDGSKMLGKEGSFSLIALSLCEGRSLGTV